jgi:hypothetical protein
MSIYFNLTYLCKPQIILVQYEVPAAANMKITILLCASRVGLYILCTFRRNTQHFFHKSWWQYVPPKCWFQIMILWRVPSFPCIELTGPLKKILLGVHDSVWPLLCVRFSVFIYHVLNDDTAKQDSCCSLYTAYVYLGHIFFTPVFQILQIAWKLSLASNISHCRKRVQRTLKRLFVRGVQSSIPKD